MSKNSAVGALINLAKRHKMRSLTKFVMICGHVTTLSSEMSRLIESKLEGRGTDVDSRGHPDVLKCCYCNMDFKVEIKEVGDEGLALVFSKWLDLGSGLTPTNTKWGVHNDRDADAEIGKSGEAGAVRLRFESQPGLSHDSLSCQNASYLIAEGFKDAMDRCGEGTWVLQAGKRLPFYHSDRIFLALAFADLALVLAVWWIFFRAK